MDHVENNNEHKNGIISCIMSSIVLIQIAQLNHTLSLTTMINLQKNSERR